MLCIEIQNIPFRNAKNIHENSVFSFYLIFLLTQENDYRILYSEN